MPDLIPSIRQLGDKRERSEEERLREEQPGAEWWSCRLMEVELAWRLGGQVG